jgi:hypothetical protein
VSVTRVMTWNVENVLPPIEEDPDARIGKPGSDHAALVDTFDF